MQYSSKYLTVFLLAIATIISGCSSSESEHALTLPNSGPGVVITLGHEVVDYATWRAAFSRHDALRSTFGVEVEAILFGEDNPEIVWIIASAPSKESAEAYLADVGTARTMESDGVVGEVYRAVLEKGFSSTIDSALYPERLIVQHEVKDFNQWKTVFDGHIGSRERTGVVDLFVSHPVDDSTDVHMMFGIADVEKSMGYMSSDALRIAMKLSGVVGEPRAYFVHVAE
jgi:hypothetical protein